MRRATTAAAVIVDLRRNGGGMEGLNQYLASHFFPADTQLVLYQRYVRPTNVVTEYRVITALAAPRFLGKPVFVVAGRTTGSAAENFAYSLQQHGRATVVGERTAGAGNSAQTFGLPGGFAVQMPVARVTHPRTNRGWNGVGVVPTIQVAEHEALDSAYALALRTASEGALPVPGATLGCNGTGGAHG